MTEHARYDPDFRPLFLEGHTAHLYGAGLPMGGLDVKCIAVGALPEYIKDFGALTAAVWTRDQEDSNLEMNSWELAQYRMRVVDDVRVQVKNPSAVQQWRTKNTNFWLPKFPTDPGTDWMQSFYWCQSEFYLWEDKATPRFDLYSELTTTTSRVVFSGWRFRFNPLKPPEKPRFFIYLSDWPTTLA